MQFFAALLVQNLRWFWCRFSCFPVLILRVFLGQFLLHFGVVGAAFRVQFRLLPSTVFAAVLGQLLGPIQVRILVRFGCTFGYFLVRFLAVVLGQLLAAILVQFCCAFLVQF